MEWEKLTQRQKNHRREKARKYLSELVEKQNNTCLYCGNFIVCVDWLRKNNIPFTELDPKTRKVTYVINNVEIIAFAATTEHIKELASGGANELDNLCAVCNRCNDIKSRDFTTYRNCVQKNAGIGTLVCSKCGGEKSKKRIGRHLCRNCFLRERGKNEGNHFKRSKVYRS